MIVEAAHADKGFPYLLAALTALVSGQWDMVGSNECYFKAVPSVFSLLLPGHPWRSSVSHGRAMRKKTALFTSDRAINKKYPYLVLNFWDLDLLKHPY